MAVCWPMGMNERLLLDTIFLTQFTRRPHTGRRFESVCGASRGRRRARRPRPPSTPECTTARRISRRPRPSTSSAGGGEGKSCLLRARADVRGARRRRASCAASRAPPGGGPWIGGVHDDDHRVGVLEVVAPERPDFVLPTNVPHRHLQVLVLDLLDVEADRRDGRDQLVELQLVEHAVLPAASRPTSRMPASAEGENAVVDLGERSARGGWRSGRSERCERTAQDVGWEARRPILRTC